jgi:hypothetical protein
VTLRSAAKEEGMQLSIAKNPSYLKECEQRVVSARGFLSSSPR